MELSTLQEFAETLKKKFALPSAILSEDQLKAPVAKVIEAAGKKLIPKIESITESHIPAHKVRPDIAIYVGGLICGYVELKKPGLGADAPKLKGKHNEEQWQKLKGLPNIIYCDGCEWALYRHGERQDSIVCFDGNPTKAGKSAISEGNRAALEKLLHNFLTWSPIVPSEPEALADYLAHLARFLRDEVKVALKMKGSNIAALASEWRKYFLPTSDDAQFADSYAQTVTYAMLLARLSGAEKLDPDKAAKKLDKGNRVLARALEIVGQPDAQKELRVGFEMLQRSLEALNPTALLASSPDIWLYFYEDFLAKYDPEMRKQYGVYYTPPEVVELQIRLVNELLEKQFAKKAGACR